MHPSSPRPLFALVLVAAGALAACQPAPPPAATATHAATEATPNAAPAIDTAANALPLVVVHKSPTCGCCGAWVTHMREAGFPVEVRDEDDLVPVKSRLGVPMAQASCHTAEVGGYFVEGHVPADDVKRLLAEHPEARGLAVPGMPQGAPGMELPDGSVQPYRVELVARDGSLSTYADYESQ